jgi:hypothetical protein
LCRVFNERGEDEEPLFGDDGVVDQSAKDAYRVSNDLDGVGDSRIGISLVGGIEEENEAGRDGMDQHSP